MSNHLLRREFKPKVNELVRQAANSPLEKHIVEMLSIGEQRMTAIGETVITIEEQTTKTNGRVNAHDHDLAKFRLELEALTDSKKAQAESDKRKRRRLQKWLAGGVVFFTIFAPTIGDFIRDWLHHMLGWK